MQDNTLLLVAGVGLALVCVGLVVVGLLMLLRIVGVGTPLWTALLGGGDDEHRRIVRASSMPDLRAIAEAQDFDSARARRRAAPAQPPPVETASPFGATPTPRLGSRRSTRPELRRDDEDADLFGGLLEDEES